MTASEVEEDASKVGDKPLRRNADFVRKSRLCLELLRRMGMPTLVAKGEAEALCASLSRVYVLSLFPLQCARLTPKSSSLTLSG